MSGRVGVTQSGAGLQSTQLASIMIVSICVHTELAACRVLHWSDHGLEANLGLSGC